MPRHMARSGSEATFEVLGADTAADLVQAEYAPHRISVDPLDRAWLMGRWLRSALAGEMPKPLPPLEEMREWLLLTELEQ